MGQSNERKQVLKLITLMLNFSPIEVEQVEKSGESNWFGGLMKATGNKPGGKADNPLNKSFTELLIQYVDRESKPKPSLTFDLNDPSVSNTNKKTDSPMPQFESKQTGSSLSSNSATAVKFFNNSLISQPSNNLNDLNLINRNQPQSNLQQPAQSLANSFIEQILK